MGNLILRLRKVGARLGQGWGKVLSKVGARLGQGWGKVRARSGQKARFGQARSGQGWSKVGARLGQVLDKQAAIEMFFCTYSSGFHHLSMPLSLISLLLICSHIFPNHSFISLSLSSHLLPSLRIDPCNTPVSIAIPLSLFYISPPCFHIFCLNRITFSCHLIS